MCGIAGEFAYQSARKPLRRNIQAMCTLMRARGPDGESIWVDPKESYICGHRRLSLVDTTPSGAQPMSSDCGLVITFNGEIYNYREVRETLILRGYKFRTTSDTEVLLHLYAEKGAAMVDDLRGMFAFAIWDSEKQELFVARDAYGVKPLYYCVRNGVFSFASTVKALVKAGVSRGSVSVCALTGFLLTGSVPEPYTIADDVSPLLAGHWLKVSASAGVSVQRWYSLAQSLVSRSKSDGFVESNTQLKTSLSESVRLHMQADVPVGLFLSGGIDSTALLGLLKDQNFNNVRTITASFEDGADGIIDESAIAEKTAEMFGSDHCTRRVADAEFDSSYNSIIDGMDQPTIDGVNTWFIAKAAKEQGLKACLSGLGADEMFGGYPSFSDVPAWTKTWGWLGSGWREPASGFLDKLCRALRLSIHPKSLALLGLADSFPGSYMVRRGLFMPWELPVILGVERAREGLFQLAYRKHVEATISPDPATDYGRVMLLESSLYMKNQLLRDADWAGMAHSVEIRVPFVDRQLFEQCAPGLAQTSVSKKLLLTQLNGVPFPDELRTRKKTGFLTPMERWNRNRLPKLQARYGNYVTRGHWSRRWALQVLEDWQADLSRSAVRCTLA